MKISQLTMNKMGNIFSAIFFVVIFKHWGGRSNAKHLYSLFGEYKTSLVSFCLCKAMYAYMYAHRRTKSMDIIVRSLKDHPQRKDEKRYTQGRKDAALTDQKKARC